MKPDRSVADRQCPSRHAARPAGLRFGCMRLGNCFVVERVGDECHAGSRFPVSATAIVGVPAGTRGWRILYRTTTASGQPAVSSGTVYALDRSLTACHRRFVVAWAHPTLGTRTSCTPSHVADPAQAIPGFVAMMRAGWVVTSTDYTGLGTPGLLPYLIGVGEARQRARLRTRRRQPGPGGGRPNLCRLGPLSGRSRLPLHAPGGRHLRPHAAPCRRGGGSAGSAGSRASRLDRGPVEPGGCLGHRVGGDRPLARGSTPSSKATQVATALALANYQRLGAVCITGETPRLASEFVLLCLTVLLG